MKVAISLATAFIFAMETPANADSYTLTGNQLLTKCEQQDLFSQGMCYGYVLGVADHYLANQEPLRICMGSGVTYKQAVDVTVAFLQSRPEKRHYIAEGLVWEALHNAFPCKSN
jgi:Ssp1 endopeptidase immunity protein Rap1a